MDPAAIARPQIVTPTVQLPAGIRDATPDAQDAAIAGQLMGETDGQLLARARRHLREARRMQRRAINRSANRRARQRRELDGARLNLITAAVLCQLGEQARAGLTVTGLSVARARERAAAQMDEEPGRFAVTVENWIRDLAGQERLERG